MRFARETIFSEGTLRTQYYNLQRFSSISAKNVKLSQNPLSGKFTFFCDTSNGLHVQTYKSCMRVAYRFKVSLATHLICEEKLF